MTQSNLGTLDTYIRAEDDSSGENCIFNVVDGQWRKMIAINKLSCEKVKVGYKAKDASDWRDTTGWSNTDIYDIPSVEGCVAAGIHKLIF